MVEGPKAQDFDVGWNAWKAPADVRAHLEWHRRERAVLHRAIEAAVAGIPAPRTLEVGCGTAFDSCVLVLDRPGLEAAAIDFADGAIAAARATSEGLGVPIDLRKADLVALPFPDAAFDLAFSQGVMEHFRDPVPGLREQVRVTRPGGTVVIDVPQTLNFYTVMKLIRRAQGKWPWGWETQYTPWGLARLGRRAGLTPVSFEGYGWWGGKVDVLSLLRKAGPRRMWESLERRAGEWFLMNLVGVFRRP